MWKSKVRILKKQDKKSKQISDKTTSSLNTLEPKISFEALLVAYEECAVIAGIIKKIAASGDVWFKKTENKVLDSFLENLEIQDIFTDMLVFWVCYLERLKDGYENNTLDLLQIMTTTARLLNPEKSEYFLVQKSEVGSKEVFFNKNEILYFKTKSIRDKNYGDSIFAEAVNEVILLGLINKYYNNHFNNWNIDPNILFDKTWKLNDEQIDKIENLINDKISWIDNSSTTAFVSWDIWKIDLASKIDPDKWIWLKRELKEDVAIATNIPFSLLSPENSNRSIWENDKAILYADVIFPLHKKFLRQLKAQLLQFKLEWDKYLVTISEDEINSISFEDVELKDLLTEMKILTWYQEKWNLSANEVRRRAKLWDDIPRGDEYKEYNSKEDNAETEDELEKIKKSISKMYVWKNKS